MPRYNVLRRELSREDFELAARKCFAYREQNDLAQADMAALANTYATVICALENRRFAKVPKHVVAAIIDPERFEIREGARSIQPRLREFTGGAVTPDDFV